MSKAVGQWEDSQYDSSVQGVTAPVSAICAECSSIEQEIDVLGVWKGYEKGRGGRTAPPKIRL
jgi:hypothetical protein